jgi:hypothetical protein
MAFLYISEFAKLISDAAGKEVAAPDFSSLTAEQRVPIGAGSVQSAPLSSMTRFVLVSTDAICSIAYGANPTAVVVVHRMAANESRFYGATGPNIIAVIANV